MAKAEKSKAVRAGGEKSTPAKDGAGAGGARKAWAVIFVIVIIFVIAGGLAYGLAFYRGSSASFSTFRSNFDTAPSVAIVATADNGTAVSSTVGCATLVIEQITGSHTAHRNASTISLYVLNQTSCVYSQGLGYPTKNYSHGTPKSCLSLASGVPGIYINYSSTNSTSITPTALYISGNAGFLSMCGVAAELTAT